MDMSNKRKYERGWDPKTKTIKILVHTDPTADVDDEVAIGYLIRDLENRFPKYNIHVIISVKTKEAGIDRIIRFGGAFTPFLIGLDQTFGFENVKELMSGNTMSIIFHDGTTFLHDEFKPHFILNIAPGLDYVLKIDNLCNLLGISHQGLPDTGKGFNDYHSQKMIRYMERNFPMVVTTPFQAFDNLFGCETFKKYNIPQELHDLIAAEAYKMILGRLSPSLPLGVLYFAEGLVNLKLAESLGKPGTNCRLVFAIWEKFTGQKLEITPEISKSIEEKCNDYLDAISKPALLTNASDPIKCRDETLGYLIEMTLKLYEMGMPCFDETGTRLRYSTDGDPTLTLPEAFQKFKEIGFFTPAYDLIAAEKLVDLMVEIISE